MRGDNVMILFHTLRIHTGLCQHVCISDAWRDFMCTQRQTGTVPQQSTLRLEGNFTQEDPGFEN